MNRHFSLYFKIIALICLCALLGTLSVAVEERTTVNNEIHFRLGAERTSEPFNFFQDGTFAVLHQDNKIYVLPPVNNVDTCDQFVWSGSDIENIYPTVAMNGLTANSHYDRGRIYDAYGWWPFTLWSDNNGKWYSYMHTEDAVQVTTGQTGHGSDLRTIALWTSTDNGANWTYEGVALSIDSDYAVPGNLQVSWPRNGGTGDHKLIASPDGQYLYILYTVFSYEDPATTNDYCHGNLAIARAELDEEGRPGPFYKYYNGQFSESGVGGHETWIMSKTEGPYYTDNSQRTVMWNTYLNRYVMISADRIHHLNISYSEDLIHWTQPEIFLQEESGVPILYANLISFDSNDMVGGKSVWVYYVTENYEVRRRVLSFDKGGNLAYQKSAVASHEIEALPAATVTDNNIISGYQGPKGTSSYTNTWIYIDLGAEKAFNTIWLTPSMNGKGFPVSFSFEGSLDANSWSTIAQYENYARPQYEETQVFHVGNQQYRFVRLSVSECSEIGSEVAPFAVQLNEFKVFNYQNTTDEFPSYSAVAHTYRASTDFASTQGNEHWSYMRQGDLNIGQSYFWSPLSYNTQMNAWGKSGLYNYVGNNWMHPDENFQTARIWKVPADGIIHITGRISKKDTAGGNGVRAKILRDREQIWPLDSEWMTISYNDAVGVNVDCGIAVNANEKIFFVLDSNGSSAYDSTYWDPQIEYSPLTRMLDSRNEYSSTSGEWGYLSESNGAYSAMEWNSAEKQWKVNGSYCSIGALHMHPDANLNAVRSWRCEEAGNIVISNEVKKLDITGGDGVRLKILKNGTQIWPESGWGMLDFDDAQGIKFSVATSVNTGDTICFVLNQNQSSSYDTTYWLSNIKIAS